MSAGCVSLPRLRLSAPSLESCALTQKAASDEGQMTKVHFCKTSEIFNCTVAFFRFAGQT